MAETTERSAIRSSLRALARHVAAILVALLVFLVLDSVAVVLRTHLTQYYTDVLYVPSRAAMFSLALAGVSAVAYFAAARARRARLLVPTLGYLFLLAAATFLHRLRDWVRTGI